MLKITITSPTKCFIENPSKDDLALIKDKLTYTDTSAVFNLKNLNKNKWLKENKPYTFENRKKELEAKVKNCMLNFDQKSGRYWFHPGSISYLGLEADISNEIEYPEASKIAWRKPLPFTLYPYQGESVERLIEAKHGCVELATGTGKSAIIMTLARELGLKTAIITPSKSIFLEMLHNFEHYFGKSVVGAYGSGKKRIGKKLTVCVSKSLTLLKKGTPEYEFFSNMDVIISDESHLNAAETLETVFHDVMKDVPYRFFLSGTQVRGDGKDKLLQSIIGKKVNSLNTREAVEGGYICPVKFFIFNTRSNDIKDYKDPLKIKRKKFLYNENIADISAKISNSAWKCGQESTLILVEELEQIKMLVDRLQVPFEYVHSASKANASKYGLETRKVDQAVEAFNLGHVKVLIGTSCIATGTNIYPTHNTINWVGGASEVRTKQGAVGRSVRVLKKSKYKEYHKPKAFSKIYDFNVENDEVMKVHLKKRISMYKETTNQIKFLDI